MIKRRGAAEGKEWKGKEVRDDNGKRREERGYQGRMKG